MLTRKDLGMNGPPDFTLGQREKDYAQHWILSYLSRSGFGGVFKGGTALQKACNLPRHSEDLDFTQNDAAEPDYEAMRRHLESGGFSQFAWKTEKKKASSSARLKLAGPLYIGTPLSMCTVAMQFSRRNHTLLPPVASEVRPPYSDLLPYSLLVMDKDEIASEKVCAILTRHSARDAYDLYFLVHGGNFPELAHVDAKLERYGKKFAFAEFRKSLLSLEGKYKPEMAALTSQVVDFSIVSKGVLEAIRKMRD